MPPETEAANFQNFFAAKIKERGFSLKKLSEATGIAPAHLEAFATGQFDELPSAPYMRGYLVRLGGVLDFDGEAWWEKLKKERLVANSGPADTLPNNRFVRQSPAKLILICGVALVIILYLAFQIPIVLGRPSLSVTVPLSSPFTTTSSTFTLEGTVHSADSLLLNGDSVTVAQDGNWQKTVLLQNGINTFQIAAKKLLGGETDVTEEIIYQGATVAVPSVSATGTASSTSASSSSSNSPSSSVGSASSNH